LAMSGTLQLMLAAWCVAAVAVAVYLAPPHA
jgi:hypothetical protein